RSDRNGRSHQPPRPRPRGDALRLAGGELAAPRPPPRPREGIKGEFPTPRPREVVEGEFGAPRLALLRADGGWLVALRVAWAGLPARAGAAWFADLSTRPSSFGATWSANSSGDADGFLRAFFFFFATSGDGLESASAMSFRLSLDSPKSGVAATRTTSSRMWYTPMACPSRRSLFFSPLSPEPARHSNPLRTSIYALLLLRHSVTGASSRNGLSCILHPLSDSDSAASNLAIRLIHKPAVVVSIESSSWE
ncbi:hypothetical protein BCR34DRAFT_187117, partial [Clohesyomyces aquaticus]